MRVWKTSDYRDTRREEGEIMRDRERKREREKREREGEGVQQNKK